MGTDFGRGQGLVEKNLRGLRFRKRDIQIPVMDGLETVRRIRQGHLAGVTPSQEVTDAIRGAIPEANITPKAKVPRDIPVVALAAHAVQGDREYFLRMGMDMYLAKPIILEELAMILRRVSELSLGKAFWKNRRFYP